MVVIRPVLSEFSNPIQGYFPRPKGRLLLRLALVSPQDLPAENQELVPERCGLGAPGLGPQLRRLWHRHSMVQLHLL